MAKIPAQLENKLADAGIKVTTLRELEGLSPEALGDLSASVLNIQKIAYSKGKASVDDIAAARRVIDRYGPPPPGEGRHPLQGHRDSMG